MKSHQFFTSPTSTATTIYPVDIKQCLDKYAKIKIPSRLHPTSKFIKQFQQFFDGLTSGGPISNEQLQWLSKQLKNLQYEKDVSNKTYRACEILYTKLGILVDYADNPPAFNQIANCPKLADHIKTIKRRIPGVNISPIIIYNPGALEYLANCQSLTSDMLNLHYLANIKGYQYFPSVMNAIGRLQCEDKILYNNIQRKKISHTKMIQMYQPDFKGGFTYYEPETTTSTERIDVSKNLYYKAKLDSQKNIDFILRHADHADLIADVLIRLHGGMIGKAYQEQAETYMAMMMDKNPGEFLKFSQIFLSNSNRVLDQLKRILTEEQFHNIILDQSAAVIPGCGYL